MEFTVISGYLKPGTQFENIWEKRLTLICLQESFLSKYCHTHLISVTTQQNGFQSFKAIFLMKENALVTKKKIYKKLNHKHKYLSSSFHFSSVFTI